MRREGHHGDGPSPVGGSPSDQHLLTNEPLAGGELGGGGGGTSASGSGFLAKLQQFLLWASVTLGMFLIKVSKWKTSYGPYPFRITMVPGVIPPTGGVGEGEGEDGAVEVPVGLGVTGGDEGRDGAAGAGGVCERTHHVIAVGSDGSSERTVGGRGDHHGGQHQAQEAVSSRSAPCWIFNGPLTNGQVAIQPQHQTIDDATSVAFMCAKPLVVYVHSELNPHAQRMLPQFTSDSFIVQMLQKDFVFFATSALSNQTGFLKCTDLGVFPQFAVFAAVGGIQGGLVQVGSLEGDINVEGGKLRLFLLNCLSRFERLVASSRAAFGTAAEDVV